MFREIGKIVLFMVRALKGFPYVIKKPRLILKEVYRVGVLSLPMVIFTSIFVGIVTTIQTAYQTNAALPKYLIGATAFRIILIELSPVVISLVVCGRIASFISAELGTMKVTEQIDAIKTMGLDPHKFLAFPIILATTISLPLLVIISEILATYSSMLSARWMLGLPYSIFIYGMKTFFVMKDLVGGLLKTIFFGFVISIIATYYGINTGFGAEGVGKATTYSVVTSSALILIFDFFVAFGVFT